MEPINETTARSLLERYHQGETSLTEEKQLSTYFCQAQLPNDLLPYRALFRFFRDEAAVLPPKSAPLQRRRIYLWFLAPIAAAAACLLLFFTLYSPTQQDFICFQDGQRIQDQEEALQLAQQQWVQMSLRIEKATAIAEKWEQMKSYTETINKYIPR